MQPRPLVPFSAEPQLEGLSLDCAAHWQDGLLTLHYSLSGALQPILLPASAAEQRRRDELWQTTCFEAFLGRPGQPKYWEINLAPSGDWNLYALSDYRTGLQPEASVSQLPFTMDRLQSDPADPQTLQRLDLEVVVDLSALIRADAPLELSATTVLEHRELGCTYWAWRHTGPEADFHRRESFQPL